jgi:2-methylisocitrate lyase-like PEP mutase family enzyme
MSNANVFKELHVKGNPLILSNVWDAGSARVLSDDGAKAIATGSFAIAGALGYEDGEKCPVNEVLNTLKLICRVAQCPVSHDAERGYGSTVSEVGDYIREIRKNGIVGVNIEDGLDAAKLRKIDEQAERIAVVKNALGNGFLNARTDVFFRDDERTNAEKFDDVVERANIYAKAGADGLFVPGLLDLSLIQKLVVNITLPLNIMRPIDGPSIRELASVGVSRISHGPFLWIEAMNGFRNAVKANEVQKI